MIISMKSLGVFLGLTLLPVGATVVQSLSTNSDHATGASAYSVCAAGLPGTTQNAQTGSAPVNAMGCCLGGRGNVDNAGIVDLGDLATLVDYLTPPLGPALACVEEADVDGVGIIDLGDLAYLVDYLSPPAGPALPMCPGPVTDIDGNVYQTVAIGAQVWMVENLKVTHYRNGDPIPNVTVKATWAALTTGAYCNYNHDTSNVATYGRIYNWYAVGDSRNIAPEGWHVPSEAEWGQLELSIGMTQLQVDGMTWRGTVGGKIKETGTTHWTSPNTGATNESGFTALPGGQCNYLGNFYDLHGKAYFWSSSLNGSNNGMFRSLESSNTGIYRMGWGRESGMSVRCVRD